MSYFFLNKKFLLIFVALSISLESEIKKTTINEEIMKKSFGVVKFYNEDKGFGYIIDAENRAELFVYQEGLIDEIQDNDNVKYLIRDTRKGLEAYDVRQRY